MNPEKKTSLEVSIPFGPLDQVPAYVFAVLNQLREGILSTREEREKDQARHIAGALMISAETFLRVMDDKPREKALHEVFWWVGKAQALLHLLKSSRTEGRPKDLVKDLDPGDPPLLGLASLIFGSLRNATDAELLSIALDREEALGSSTVSDPALVRRLSKVLGPWTKRAEGYFRVFPDSREVVAFPDGSWAIIPSDPKLHYTSSKEEVRNPLAHAMVSADAYLAQQGYLLLEGVPKDLLHEKWGRSPSEEPRQPSEEPNCADSEVSNRPPRLYHRWDNATNVCSRCGTIRYRIGGVRYEYTRLYLVGSPPVFRLERSTRAGGCHTHMGQVPHPPWTVTAPMFTGRVIPHERDRSVNLYLYVMTLHQASSEGVPIVDWLARVGVLERETYTRVEDSDNLWVLTLYLRASLPLALAVG